MSDMPRRVWISDDPRDVWGEDMPPPEYGPATEYVIASAVEADAAEAWAILNEQWRRPGFDPRAPGALMRTIEFLNRIAARSQP